MTGGDTFPHSPDTGDTGVTGGDTFPHSVIGLSRSASDDANRKASQCVNDLATAGGRHAARTGDGTARERRSCRPCRHGPVPTPLSFPPEREHAEPRDLHQLRAEAAAKRFLSLSSRQVLTGVGGSALSHLHWRTGPPCPARHLECHGPGTRPVHSARRRDRDPTAKLPDFWTLLSSGGRGTS